MWLPSIFAVGRSASGRTRHPRAPAKPRRSLRLNLEQLEDRTLLSSYSAASVSDLIADINAANAAGGSNTIMLTAPTSNPYVLSGVDNTTDGPNGLPVIANKDILTIVGNGDTIDAFHVGGRLLDVASGASLTMENVTLENGSLFGSGVSAEGGAIYNLGTLILSAVTVQGCVAEGTDGVVKLFNDRIKATPGNAAAGGGIWSNGSLTLENGTVLQNNQAIGGIGGNGPGGVGGDASGGGLYVAGGTAYVSGVSINNNITRGGFGGTWFSNQPPIGGLVENANGIAYGGGLYVCGGKVNLSGDTVNGNLAGFNDLSRGFGRGVGGGMILAAGTVTLCNDTVENNFVYDTLIPGIGIANQAKVYIDAFTVAHVDSINGEYILQNC
jgi:hypothetical protein